MSPDHTVPPRCIAECTRGVRARKVSPIEKDDGRRGFATPGSGRLLPGAPIPNQPGRAGSHYSGGQDPRLTEGEAGGLWRERWIVSEQRMQRTISPINQEAPTDSLRADVVSFARASGASLLARMLAFMRGPPLMVKCPKENRPYGLRYLTEQLLHSCRPRFFLSRPICHDSAVGVKG